MPFKWGLGASGLGASAGGLPLSAYLANQGTWFAGGACAGEGYAPVEFSADLDLS